MKKDWLEDIFRFKNCRGLLGVYVSYKPRKHSAKLFGFARFHNKEAATRALEKIDGLEVGGSKLRITFAKYDNNTRSGTMSGGIYPDSRSHIHKVSRNARGKNIIPHYKNGDVDERKYADVVNDGDEAKRGTMLYQNSRVVFREVEKNEFLPDGDPAKIKVSPNEENMQWLKRSAIGFTEHPINLEWITEKLLEHQIDYEKLTLWGQHKFILTLRS